MMLKRALPILTSHNFLHASNYVMQQETHCTCTSRSLDGALRTSLRVDPRNHGHYSLGPHLVVLPQKMRESGVLYASRASARPTLWRLDGNDEKLKCDVEKEDLLLMMYWKVTKFLNEFFQLKTYFTLL